MVLPLADAAKADPRVGLFLSPASLGGGGRLNLRSHPGRRCLRNGPGASRPGVNHREERHDFR